MSPPVFMTAAWRDLILLNYSVPDLLLAPFLSPGLSLDRYKGSAYVSLVAFDFLDARVFGRHWPWHTNFAEINLRAYVRHDASRRRGVIFVREIVPRLLTAWLARLLYNEPYVTAPITSESARGSTFEKRYTLRWRGQQHTIAARGDAARSRPSDDSVEHFFKEHEWGFGRTRAGRLLTYQVTHPVWDVYPACAHTLNFNFAAVYGEPWGILNNRTPSSVTFAVGSEISVFKPA